MYYKVSEIEKNKGELSSKMDLIKKITDNPKLVSFCNKVLTYESILGNNESRYLFLASLISADTLVDEESCRETLDTAYFIINHMDFFQLEDNVREEVENYTEKAINIALSELHEFKKQRNNKQN
jgi:predicted phage-related endonuclease